MKLADIIKKLYSNDPQPVKEQLPEPEVSPESKTEETSSASQLKDILNREEFSYDPEKDPAYDIYMKEMQRQGKRASEDVMGIASSLTGGTPSSYAVTAASQAAGEYVSAAAEKAGDLYEAAYKRYQDKYRRDVENYELTKKAEDSVYEKQQDEWKKKFDVAVKKAAMGDKKALNALETSNSHSEEDEEFTFTKDELRKLLESVFYGRI